MGGNRRYGWAFVIAAALFGVAIAVIAYNVGVSDGFVAGGAVPVGAARRVQWMWHGAGVLWPLLFLAFWMFLFRGACWRRHYWYGGPNGPYWPGPRRGVAAGDEEMDEWHRRAHEQMKEDRPADDSGRRG